MAVCKGDAIEKEVHLNCHIDDLGGNSKGILLVLAFKMLNNGSHAGNKLGMKEFIILPWAYSASRKLWALEWIRNLKNVILTVTSWGTKKLWGCGYTGKVGYTDQAVTGMDVDALELFRDSKYNLDVFS